jgi:hypothetical protein
VVNRHNQVSASSEKRAVERIRDDAPFLAKPVIVNPKHTLHRLLHVRAPLVLVVDVVDPALVGRVDWLNALLDLRRRCSDKLGSLLLELDEHGREVRNLLLDSVDLRRHKCEEGT